jgi:hypothetical protein
MRFAIAILFWALTCVPLSAHELTPTYFEMKPSIYAGVYKTTMTMFNRREDIKYYQIEVFDKDWNPVSFATNKRIIDLNYLQRTNFEIYFREKDVAKVTYICTRSKILKGEETTVIASNICSKIK